MAKVPQITIIGYAGKEEYPADTILPTYCYDTAEDLGRLIGQQKWYLITGGESGIMECSARGSKSVGGTTLGVLTGQNRGASNEYTDIEIVTNSYVTSSTPILIAMADIVIVCGGGAGTLQEIAIAYRLNKPIILMQKTGGWADKLTDKYLDERNKFPLRRAKSADECITLCRQIISSQI